MKTLNSIGHAIQGIRRALRTETNLRIHFIVLVLVLITGYNLGFILVEWCICLLCSAMVISLELLNTALEKMADFVHIETNDTIGQIKDISAGAVLIASLFSLIIGLIIIVPKLLSL